MKKITLSDKELGLFLIGVYIGIVINHIQLWMFWR